MQEATWAPPSHLSKGKKIILAVYIGIISIIIFGGGVLRNHWGKGEISDWILICLVIIVVSIVAFLTYKFDLFGQGRK